MAGLHASVYVAPSTGLVDWTAGAVSPGSLEPNEIYGVVAFILAENGIIRRDEMMDAATLPKVTMPASR